MLRDEVRKTEAEEAAHARERLFTPTNEKGENKDQQSVDKPNGKTNEALESETSGKAEEASKDEKAESPNDNPEEMNGSTVEIVQPADLKPKHLGFTRTLLLAMFAAMIGTGAQYGYALGVMNAPSEVKIEFHVHPSNSHFCLVDQKLHETPLRQALQHDHHGISPRGSVCHGYFSDCTRRCLGWPHRWTAQRSSRPVSSSTNF